MKKANISEQHGWGTLISGGDVKPVRVHPVSDFRARAPTWM